MKTIKIEMIHDLVCSWCPIGYVHVTEAMKAVDDRINIELSFLPFEVNPTVGIDGEEIQGLLMRRMNWTMSDVRSYRKNLLGIVSKVGLSIDFTRRTHYYNTHAGHMLMHWAGGYGKQHALHEAVRIAYHEEGVDLSNIENLKILAASVGLDGEKFEAALHDRDILASFKAKHEKVTALGIRSVPSFLIDDRELITGSNSTQFFIDYFLTKSGIANKFTV